MLGRYPKKMRIGQGLQLVFGLKPLGYHIEWCPLWNPAAGLYVMWELGLW